MSIFIQIVSENTQIAKDDINFFIEYKYWIIFGIFLVLLFSIILYKEIKKRQSIKNVTVAVNQQTNKTDKPRKYGDKPTSEENKTHKEELKPKILENVVIEKDEVKAESPSTKELGEESLLEKNNKSKQPPAPKVIKSAIIDEISSKQETADSNIKTIGYQPTAIFEQGVNYDYPLVLMPKTETKIKFPRKGRSNKTGYTEDAFFEYMKHSFKNDFQLYNDRHIPSKNVNFVYEPDIVLINEKNGKNIFIDIEIDEPYEGFSRTPTHELGKDTIRNNFFTKRGWIVIRFSEIQIHQDPKECCYHIAKVVAAIDPDYEIPFQFSLYGDLELKASWDSLQAKKWAKAKYREKYLGIENFGTRPDILFNYDIEVSHNDELLENEINDEFKIPEYEKVKGPLGVNEHNRDKRLRFDQVEHRYYIDGNPDTISASQLIDKFFPEFDAEYWSQRKANERGVDVEEILQEWETKRYNSANLGTELHEQIENYYNGLPYNEELPEFQYFLKFKEKYATMVPYRSEWRIFDEEYLIAGTIDMVYQKEGDELYMFDWKRSEKVVNAQGIPKLPSYDYASGELSHLSDNSYNRYAVQQNIYKYILEKHYNKKITSMNLLILHPSFDTYHHIKLPDLTEEVKYVFENSKHYR